MNPELELQAGRFETIAAELEAALTHARIAASHLHQGEVPRGCAHAFALEGHLLTVRQTLDEAAKVHAAHARPQAPPSPGKLV